VIHFVFIPKSNFFIEQDPTLSYPYRTGSLEAIPNWLGAVLSIPVGLFVMFLVHMFFVCKFTEHDLPPRAMNVFLPYLAFIEAMGLNFFFTEFFKSFSGRKRPNFFAYCNYQGYRDALEAGNFTMYQQLTKFGNIGDIDNCWDKANVRDAQSSFPSGHASGIFCGIGFTALFVMYLLNKFSRKHNFAKNVVGFSLIMFSFAIAATRPRDYYHNYDDILAGCIVGMTSAFVGFSFNFGYKHTTSRSTEEGLLTDRA